MNIIIESKIKEVRQSKGISVRELAAMTGMSKTYISDVENNHSSPTLQTLCHIAAVLDVEPEKLYNYKIINDI